MSLEAMSVEILENIVSNLHISDIRNLKLTSYVMYDKIGNYDLDIGAIIRYCMDCKINSNVYMLMRNGVIIFVGDFIIKYTKYYGTLQISLFKGDVNKKEKGEKLIELGFYFFGYYNMVEENEIYVKNIEVKDSSKQIYETIRDIYYKIDIYFSGIIKDVIRYMDDYNFVCNISNYEKLTCREKRLLMEYMKNNEIKY